MTRLTYSEAWDVASDAANASPLALIEAKRVLRNRQEDDALAIAHITAEMRRRSAFVLDGTTYAVPVRAVE
jgi:hypothetical protein